MIRRDLPKSDSKSNQPLLPLEYRTAKGDLRGGMLTSCLICFDTSSIPVLSREMATETSSLGACTPDEEATDLPFAGCCWDG